MPRRYRPEHRVVVPDSRFHNETIAVLINKVMTRGKKSTAQRVIYDAMDLIGERTSKDPMDTFDLAMRNAGPMIEVKPRRVGGATYQVPVEVSPDRRVSLAMRWIIDSARSRPGKTFAQKLADELMDAAKNTGTAIRKREDTHRMAEANRAFAHYRW
jgi:small subunit ribosomal protein S7